ncbi:transglycosylase family protein [Kitasatospora sp. NPDC085464]|uniref:transglycosylase family protein n=1 Tax=Kitasatospora sp. NPDC085464 TaxID=3364063 RepID=UPI0037CABB85
MTRASSRAARTRRMGAAATGVLGLTMAAASLGTGQANAASVTTWDKVAQCESTGNWSINTGNTYYGGLQIKLSTWQANGGTAYAAYPHQATTQQQILVAENILASQGAGAWGSCGAGAGLGYDHANPYADQAPTPTPAPAPRALLGGGLRAP